MKFFRMVLLVMVCSVSGMAYAHGGHTAVSVAEAQDIARHVAVKLAEEDRGMGFGKLDESWKDIPQGNVAIGKSGPGYYIVTLKHDLEGRTLHVLMSKAGDVYDVNFSGEFQGIK